MKILLLLLLACTKSWSFVQVNPVRFYIKDSKFSHFTVRNTQSKSVNVSISNKYFGMLPDGKMVEENNSAKNELKKILFTPNSFTLGPGEKQVVRFFIKDTIVGNELRTYAHILTDVKEEQKTGEDSKGTSTSLTPKVAIAIPIIYRLTDQKDNMSFTDEKFLQKDSDCLMSAKWVNKHHSSYVNFEAFDSEGKNIFKLNGVSNYLQEYNWNLIMPDLKCDKINLIKIFDVDNDVYIINREVKT